MILRNILNINAYAYAVASDTWIQMFRGRYITLCYHITETIKLRNMQS